MPCQAAECEVVRQLWHDSQPHRREAASCRGLQAIGGYLNIACFSMLNRVVSIDTCICPAQ